jgi:hypothetical protein
VKSVLVEVPFSVTKPFEQNRSLRRNAAVCERHWHETAATESIRARSEELSGAC